MCTGLSIMAVVATIVALTQGRPALANDELSAHSIVPNEPTNKQKTAQPKNEVMRLGARPVARLGEPSVTSNGLSSEQEIAEPQTGSAEPAVRPDKPH